MIEHRLLVFVVLTRVAQTALEFARLLRQRPDQALACRSDVRLPVKDGIRKGLLCVDDAPPSRPEHSQQISQEQRIKQIEVNEQRMRHAAPQHVKRKLVVKLGAIPNVIQVGLPVLGRIEGVIGVETLEEALFVIPVGSVNRDSSIAVAVALEKDS